MAFLQKYFLYLYRNFVHVVVLLRSYRAVSRAMATGVRFCGVVINSDWSRKVRAEIIIGARRDAEKMKGKCTPLRESHTVSKFKLLRILYYITAVLFSSSQSSSIKIEIGC